MTLLDIVRCRCLVSKDIITAHVSLALSGLCDPVLYLGTSGASGDGGHRLRAGWMCQAC